MVKKYCKKPEPVEALQLTRESWQEWTEMEKFAEMPNKAAGIEGTRKFGMIVYGVGTSERAGEGDWIVKNKSGVLSVVTADVFKAEYIENGGV